ncbi:MAG: metal-dependent hydrolase [Bacteroidetes bacterium SW_9_63_38]|nr:MAG: metal-dependent hydrolase [Bacteroidetes bacterium SW_9_63_38]
MDSLTQITLGAAVGEAVAGREAGKNAPLWGAFFGTLPDLDVLANPFLTEAQSLLWHRGPSHSLLLGAVLTPLLALALARIHDDGPSWRRWVVLVGSVLFTHIGLDCLTTYGTQIFWPFTRTPVIIGSIFIIDPLYTIPLAAGLLIGLRWPSTARARRVSNYVGLAISSGYLLITLINKAHVESVFQASLQSQGPPAERVFTKPTAFNNLLWTAIAEGEDGFYVGFYSLLDEDRAVDFRSVPKRHDQLGNAADSPFVDRLRWFSRGYFIVRETGNGRLTIQDLRFGRSDLGLTRDGTYIFTFVLDRNDEGQITGFQQERPEVRVRWPLLRRFVARIGGRPLRLNTTSDLPRRNTSVNGSIASQ